MIKKFLFSRRFIFSVIAVTVYFILANLGFGYFCPSMVVIGLPCPACGMTRAFFELFTGGFTESLKMNPMLLPSIAYIVYYIYSKKKRVFWVVSIIFFAVLFGTYSLGMQKYFPYREPYVLNERALVAEVIKAVFY